LRAPSPAFVIALIALFVALGGTSFAAINALPKNSVGSKQLKKNAVTTAKIKNGAVTGAKINPATLGTVPSAANADTLGGLSAEQVAQSSKLHCPTGTVLASGVCFETALRPYATYVQALETCASIDRSLPSPGPLAAYLLANHAPNQPEANWAGSFFSNGTEFFATLVLLEKSGALEVGTSLITGIAHYRCATQPTN
jgi:hypothetical protein